MLPLLLLLWHPCHFHRLQRCMTLEGTLGNVVRHPAQARAAAACCSGLWTASFWILPRSAKVSITPLGSMFQCSTTLVGKKVFLAYLHGFCVLIWAPLLLVLSLGSTEKNLAVPSLVPSNNIPRAFSAADWTLHLSLSQSAGTPIL